MKRNRAILFALALASASLFQASDAGAMSVSLKDGSSYSAEASSVENMLTIKKNGSNVQVPIADVKTIDFADETKEVKSAAGESTETEIPADVKAILSMVPDKSKFPNAGGYVIEDEDIHVMNPDGTSKVRSHYIFKIFEDRAVDNSITLGYAFERESAKIVMARTISEDGKVYNLDPKDIKEGDMFRGAHFYSNTHKIISATLPNVKKGSIIEYIIEQNTFKPIIEGYFCPSVYFAAHEPKRHCRVEVRVPKNRKMKWISKNFDRFYDKSFEKLRACKDPKVIEDSSEITYVCEAFDIPEIISEPEMPGMKDVTPYIQFSAYENWDKIYEWDIDKFEKHISDVSEDMRKKVAELTKDCKNNDEKVAKIYHYVQQEIRYISIKGDTIAGRAGHPAKTIFANKYGDCTDKSILMSALLKIAGINCYPAALMAGGATWDPEVAHIYSNHKICFLSYDSKEIFLDSTSQDSRFPFFRVDDHDRNILVSQLRKMIRSGMPMSTVKSSRDIKILDDGGITVKGSREFDGQFEYSIRARNKSLKEDQIKDDYKQRLNATMPGVTLKKLEYTDLMDLSKQVLETSEYEAPHVAIIAGDLMLFSVPGYSFNFNETSLKERKYPIDYDYLTRAESSFNFELPKNYKVKYLPKKFELENKYMKFNAEYAESAPGVVTFKDCIERKTRMVDPDDYAAYKADIDKILKFAGEKAVIEKEKK